MRTLMSSIIFGVALAAAGACSASNESQRRGTEQTGGSGQTGGNGNGGIGSGGVVGNGGFAAFGAIGASGGTGGIDFDGGCEGISQAAENTRQPSDIVIAVDQSGSMDLETQWVQQQLNGFSQQIINSGIDVHVVLIAGIAGSNPMCVDPPLGSGGCPTQDNNPPRYTHVDQQVESHTALDLIISTYPQYRQVLRPEASKNVLVISDDTPAAMNTAQFDAALKALDPMWQSYKFNGIVAPVEGLAACATANPCCGISAISVGDFSDYPRLIQQTQGVFGDLCLQNFQPVWDALSTAIITGSALACEWAIPPPPEGQELDPALVNVIYTGGGLQRMLGHLDSSSECPQFRDAWYYDSNDSPTKVLVCPELCQEIQSGQAQRMDLIFGCASEPPVPK